MRPLPRAARACTPRASITDFTRKGHRANGFSTDGGFAEYAINNVNTMVHIPDDMSDAEATLIVTAGTAMYGLDVMGGIIAGEGVVVVGPGPDRPDGRGGRQSSGRAAGEPDRHARQAVGDGPTSAPTRW